MNGKIRYVTRRLRDLSTDQLVEHARKVNEDYDGGGELAHLLALAGAHGAHRELKNLIFAANGPKPKIVLRDAIDNTIEIVANAEHCLVYDRALPQAGLTWSELTRWWASSDELDPETELAAARSLYGRVLSSMEGNDAERFLFMEYGRLYARYGFGVPALIPQVCLHYDPYTRSAGATLVRQRMDFLILLPGQRRIVLELDGIHHYADESGRATSTRYAIMVGEDRKLRLAGYEVYRFGGQELVDRGSSSSDAQRVLPSRSGTCGANAARGRAADQLDVRYSSAVRRESRLGLHTLPGFRLAARESSASLPK